MVVTWKSCSDWHPGPLAGFEKRLVERAASAGKPACRFRWEVRREGRTEVHSMSPFGRRWDVDRWLDQWSDEMRRLMALHEKAQRQ